MSFCSTRSPLFLLVVVASLLLGQAVAFKFTFYSGPQCRSSQTGASIDGPSGGCKPKPGNSQSAIIKSTGAVDDDFSVTFFASNNCDPGTEVWRSYDIMSGDETKDHTCFSGRDGAKNLYWGSYEVWDLRKVDDNEL